MGKLADKIIESMKVRYKKTGIPWTKTDQIVWKLTFTILPRFLVIIPFFWLFKKLFIDYLLNTKGFEVMVAYAIILVIMRPMIFDLVMSGKK